MSKKIKISQIFKDHQNQYSQLNQSILELRQPHKKQIYYITACQKFFTFFNQDALIYIRQSKKKTAIGLIQQCKTDTKIPLVDLPQSSSQLEINCIDRVQRGTKQVFMIIHFKSKVSQSWKIQFSNSKVSDMWSRLFNYKNSIIKQPSNKQDKNTFVTNLQQLQNSSTVSRIFLIKTKIQRLFQYQLQQMSLPQIQAVLEQYKKDFDRDNKKRKLAVENLQLLQIRYSQLQVQKDQQQERFIKQIEEKKAVYEGQINRLIQMNEKQSLQKERLWQQDRLKLNQLLQQQTSKNICLQKQKTALKLQLQQMQQKHLQLKKQIEDIGLQYQAIIKSLNQEHQTQNNLLKQQLADRQNIILQIKVNKSSLSSQIFLLQTKLQEKKIKYQRQLSQMIYALQEQKKDANHKLQSHEKQIQSLNAQRMRKQSLVRQLQQDRLLHIFEREALSNQNDAKRFLMTQIQALTQSRIRLTKFIYQKDERNKVNFHGYIDGVRNLCLVVRTAYNHLLAGFTIQPFSQTEPAFEGGILVSMTNNQAYSCRAGKRAISYDDFFLIFGNSQLRIRSGEGVIFSNFGIANGYYESRGDKVQKLIGENKEREVVMKSYEIYEVIFQQ